MRHLPLMFTLALLGCEAQTVVVDDISGTTPGGLDSGSTAPDISVSPGNIDFGVTVAGARVDQLVTVSNDGDADLDVTLSVNGGADYFAVDNAASSVAPGTSTDVPLHFVADTSGVYFGNLELLSNDADEPVVNVTLSGEVGVDEDHDGWADGPDCDDADPAVNPDAAEVWYDGVDQNCDGLSDYDQDGDGHDDQAFGGDDCDDTDAAVSPDATETWYDGVDADCDNRSDYDQDGDGYDASDYGGADCDDTNAVANPGTLEVIGDGFDNDCDGNIDEALSTEDLDHDGYSEVTGDCNDSDATVNPAATEVWYNGLDQDCSGGSDYDEDGDGYDTMDYGGDDCLDSDATINPAASDAWYDGVDANCDGASDYDQDGDGYDSADYGGTDCDDLDATVNPGAADTAYDGVDQDCSGTSDYDADQDGHDSDLYGGDDCNDFDPTVNPGTAETWYDGTDQDCSGGSDYDQDGDGQDSSAYGGADCDDTNSSVYSGATDTWYDGVDSDCSGNSDYDQDGDGFDSSAYAGTDCNDLDPSVHPGAVDIWYDGIDTDCSGGSDYDQDGDGYVSAAYGGNDCDDTDATIHPGAAEIWYDGTDQDCSGGGDYDQDGDSYTDATYGGLDCDDTASAVHPGATEVCDGLDNDCNGSVDDGITSGTWYQDADGDGYGNASVTTTGCAAPSGYVSNATDCDDTAATTSPGSPEISYDRADNDCDGYQDDMVAETETSWTVLGTYASDAIGNQTYAMDDLDGDGDPELVVCAQTANGSSYTTDYGVMSFHDVDTSGLDADLTDGYLEIYGDGSDDDLGSAFVTLDDLDSDGAVENAFGAYQNDRDATDNGRIYIFDIDGWTGYAYDSSYDEGSVTGHGDNAWLGYSMAGGDFDGDGTRELVAGSPGDTSAKGRVYVYFERDNYYTDSIDAQDASFYTTGVSSSDHLGYSVAMGELTGDGYDDLVACGPDDDDNGSASGTCWIVAGSTTRDTAGTHGTTISSLYTAYITGSAASDQLGLTPQSLSIGDLDNDGQDDLAIGVPGYDGGTTNGGAVWVYRGGTLSGAETSATTTWLVTGDGALGTSVNLTGDVEGDGTMDLLAGATTAGASGQGQVYLFAGGQSAGTYSLPDDQYASWLGAAASDLLGTSVSSTLDLDADGRDDFAAGATGNDDAASGAGKVYVLPAYP